LREVSHYMVVPHWMRALTQKMLAKTFARLHTKVAADQEEFLDETVRLPKPQWMWTSRG